MLFRGKIPSLAGRRKKRKRTIEKGAFTLPEDFLEEVAIENQEAICEALILFSNTSLDFVDCILIARHRVLGDDVVSFDKKLNKLL